MYGDATSGRCIKTYVKLTSASSPAFEIPGNLYSSTSFCSKFSRNYYHPALCHYKCLGKDTQIKDSIRDLVRINKYIEPQ